MKMPINDLKSIPTAMEPSSFSESRRPAGSTRMMTSRSRTMPYWASFVMRTFGDDAGTRPSAPESRYISQ